MALNVGDLVATISLRDYLTPGLRRALNDLQRFAGQFGGIFGSIGVQAASMSAGVGIAAASAATALGALGVAASSSAVIVGASFLGVVGVLGGIGIAAAAQAEGVKLAFSAMADSVTMELKRAASVFEARWCRSPRTCIRSSRR